MLFLLFAVSSLFAAVSADHWAVLVAGSNQYYNYRHQADIYHAYQILVSHGVPKDNIITFFYDDIAHNPENPTPGIVINKPNGPDVYHGVVGDYTKAEVTPENFLKAIQGIAPKAGKKVLKSGPNDHVFIFLSDHGAPGFFAFPDGELTATDFNKAIKVMNQKQMYKQMVIYLEACESGSMFSGVLPSNIAVYATTASNPSESSYACYWDAKRQTYLGDLYSVSWMEDSDKANMNVESLLKQFTTVRTETNLSHVMSYGDQSFSSEPIGEFQGAVTAWASTADALVSPRASRGDAVRSEHVKLLTLRKQLAAASENGDYSKLQRLQREIDAEIALRERIDATFSEVARRVSGSSHEANRLMSHVDNSVIPFDCYEPLIKLIDDHCFNLPQNEWAMYRMHVLVTLCREGYDSTDIREALLAACSSRSGADSQRLSPRHHL